MNNADLDHFYARVATQVNRDLAALWKERNWKGKPPLVTVGIVELVVKYLSPTPPIRKPPSGN